MRTKIDTFIYLARDIEQSFQRIQILFNSTHYNLQEIDQVLNHISCTLDDLEKVNELLHSSSNIAYSPVNITSNQNVLYSLNLPEHDELNLNEENTKLIETKFNNQISIENLTQQKSTINYNEEKTFLSSKSDTKTIDLLSLQERTDFILCMKKQFNYYKTKRQTETQMEIIHLDQAYDDEEDNIDSILRKQDEHLEDVHHSIVSLKNLTHNINFEIDDHLRVLDNLGIDMTNSQNRIENLTNRTQHFIRTSTDCIGGHTCLFTIAVGLFFLIVILILFF